MVGWNCGSLSDRLQFDANWTAAFKQVEAHFSSGLAGKQAVGDAAAEYFSSAGRPGASGGQRGFPYVAFDGLPALTASLAHLSPVYGIEWMPYVSREERRSWEEYAKTAGTEMSKQWGAVAGSPEALEGYRTQLEKGIFEVPEEEEASRKASADGEGAAAASELRNSTPPAPRPASASTPFFVPVFMAHPLEPNVPVIMFDLYSQRTRAELVDRVLASGMQRASDMIYLIEAAEPVCATFVLTPVAVPDAAAASPALASRLPPHAASGGRVAGFSGVLFLWNTILEEALPDGAAGVDTELVSPQGAVHTFRVEGGSVRSLGAGARAAHGVASPALDARKHSVSFDVAGDTWELRVYPTPQFAASFAHRDAARWGSAATVLLWLGLSLHAFVRSHASDVTNRKKVSEYKGILDHSEKTLTRGVEVARAPLSNIIGLADCMLVGNEAVTERQHTMIEAIKASGMRLLNMVNDMVDEATMRDRTLDMAMTKVDLRATLAEVLYMHKPMVPPNVTLENRLPLALPNVIGDQTRVMQIFHNVVENAVRCTRKGSIIVRAESNGSMMEVTVKCKGDLSLTLDNGQSVGISPLVHQLVQAHDGAVAFSSDSASRMMAVVRLPTWSDDNTPRKSQITAAAADSLRQRVSRSVAVERAERTLSNRSADSADEPSLAPLAEGKDITHY